MIIKFNEYINEGLIDKMTPKTKDEINSALKSMLSNIKPLVSPYTTQWDSYIMKYFPEVKEIAKALKTPMSELYLIETIDEDFDTVLEYVNEILNGVEPDDYVESPDNDEIDGGEWECFVKYKIAKWYRGSQSSVDAIIFSMKSTNESLRDKMVPVSDDIIEKAIKNKTGIEKLRAIKNYNLWKYFKQDEIQEVWDNLSLIEMIELSSDYSDYEEIIRTIKNHYDKKEEAVKEFDMLPLYKKIVSIYNIVGVAFNWADRDFIKMISGKFNYIVTEDYSIVEIIEMLSDDELVELYGILIDKIKDLK